jgi:hypothetical protein
MKQQTIVDEGSDPERGGRSLGETELAKMRAAAPALHNGTYTVSHPGRGHFTVRVGTAQGGALAGKRIIYMLTGPDNVHDYTGVAFWNDQAQIASVWQKWRGPTSDPRNIQDGFHYQQLGWSIVEQKVAIFLDLALRLLMPQDKGKKPTSHFATGGGGYTIQRSSRCVRCNRELTHPESITLGVGPECAGKVER